MSLRMFHIFFIAVSVMLTGAFTAWCLSLGYLLAAAASLAAALALAAYGVAFVRKSRYLGIR